MTWIGPDAVRDRARLDEWCDTVGPPIIQSSPISSMPSVEAVAVVTWNTHVGAGDVTALVKELRNGAFTDGLHVRHFVLLIQEALRRGPAVPRTDPAVRLPASIGGSSASVTQIEDLARALELNLLYVPAMRNGPSSEDRGNALLSTLPFDDLLIVELPFERQRRLAIAARVWGRRTDGSEWSVRVATMHFDTSLAMWRGGPAQARVRQARALISALSEPVVPTILAGDLNTWWGDDEPAVQELRAAFPDAISESSRQTTWQGPLGAATRVDYLFARTHGRSLRVHRLPGRFGSDHYPLMTLVPVE